MGGFLDFKTVQSGTKLTDIPTKQGGMGNPMPAREGWTKGRGDTAMLDNVDQTVNTRNAAKKSSGIGDKGFVFDAPTDVCRKNAGK